MQPLMISTSIERYDPLLTSSESLALTGFLTGYSGLTRVALDRHATYIVAAFLAGAARLRLCTARLRASRSEPTRHVRIADSARLPHHQAFVAVANANQPRRGEKE